MSSREPSPIVSASRRTDIPALHAEWMANRLDAGYVLCANPYSGRPYRVDLDAARFFVFWTKHPSRAFAEVLSRLNHRGVGYYMLYTLNDYETEGLEPGLPDLRARIDTFSALSERIGRERMVWRFDPLVLTPALGVADLLQRVEHVGVRLGPYTHRLIYSFMDVSGYRRVRQNLAAGDVRWLTWRPDQMKQAASGLQDLCRSWGIQLRACCEPTGPGKCIDDDLMRRISPCDVALTDFLSSSLCRKDPGQRRECGCIRSRDIGRYDTCTMGCLYCYASRVGQADLSRHDPTAEML